MVMFNWAAYKCSKCEAYFVCEGDPANWGTIGLYFVDPPLVSAMFSSYHFETDADPMYQKTVLFSGFEFTHSRVTLEQ